MMRITCRYTTGAVTQQAGYREFTVTELMCNSRITVAEYVWGHISQTG